MSYDLESTNCPKCGADLTRPDSVAMRPSDSGHFERDEYEIFFVFDQPMSVAYLEFPGWVPDAACVACGADIYGEYAVFSG